MLCPFCSTSYTLKQWLETANVNLLRSRESRSLYNPDMRQRTASAAKRSKGGLREELSWKQAEECYLFTDYEDLPSGSLNP